MRDLSQTMKATKYNRDRANHIIALTATCFLARAKSRSSDTRRPCRCCQRNNIKGNRKNPIGAPSNPTMVSIPAEAPLTIRPTAINPHNPRKSRDISNVICVATSLINVNLCFTGSFASLLIYWEGAVPAALHAYVNELFTVWATENRVGREPNREWVTQWFLLFSHNQITLYPSIQRESIGFRFHFSNTTSR